MVSKKCFPIEHKNCAVLILKFIYLFLHISGKETAKNLVQRGAKVILACRNSERANKAAEDIRKSTNQQGTICVMKLDLTSFESVRQFAKEVKKLKQTLF